MVMRRAHKARKEFHMKFATWLRHRRDASEASIRRTWDRERSKAMSPSHQAEIDAIFSRYL